MDLNLVSWAINALLGVALYLLKNAHQDVKDNLKEARLDIDKLYDTKLDKYDFKEFKEELWRRLDEVKSDVKQALRK